MNWLVPQINHMINDMDNSYVNVVYRHSSSSWRKMYKSEELQLYKVASSILHPELLIPGHTELYITNYLTK